MPLRILNVDPDQASRRERSRVLAAAGFATIEAGTADEALRLVAAGGVVLGLLDAIAPGLPGSTVVEELRRHRIPVLHVAPCPLAVDEIHRALEAADAYVVEPLDPAILTAQVTALVRERCADRTPPPFEEEWSFPSRLLEAVGESVIATDTTGKIVYWSPAAETMYQWRAEEVMGRNVVDVLAAKPSESACAAILEQVSAGRAWSGEFLVRRKNGEEFWAQVTDTAVRDSAGRVIGIAGVSRDISALKKAEETLRFQAKVLSEVSDAVIALDLDRRITFFNTQAERVYGVSAQEAIGLPLRQLCTVVWLTPESERAFWKSIRAAKEWRGENIHRLRDGSKRWVEVTVSPICGADGAVSGGVCVIRDITARKAAERELRETKERYRQWMDTIPQLAWRYDPAAATTEFNKQWYEYSGQNPDDAEVGGWQALIHPDDRFRLETVADGADRAGGCYEGEFRFRRASDGSYRWHLLRAVAVKGQDGGVLFWFGTATDIENEKCAEAALRESEERLRMAAVSGRMGVWSTDVGNRVELSELTRKIYGFPAEGDVSAEQALAAVHPEDRTEVAKAVRAAVERGQPFSIEHRALRPDGATVWVSVRGRRVENDGRRRLFGIVYDVTADVLAHRELENSALALKRSNEELEHFASAVSHDLQEPLRTTAALGQMLIRRYQNHFDDEARRLADQIGSGVDRMQSLINDLLEYSRVVHEPHRPEREVSCEGPFAEALMSLSTQIATSGAVITHDPLPTLMVEDRMVARLFQNLISNAIKYRREAPPRVHVSAERRAGAGEWLFSVRDNGMGIDMKYAGRIFGVFQRLHSREAYPGSGLGLAIAKRIVERMGGRIWVESEPGVGSTFQFTIPAG